MREPDARLLQLLPNDRSVRVDVGRIDLDRPRRLIAGRAMTRAVLCLRLFGDGKGEKTTRASADLHDLREE